MAFSDPEKNIKQLGLSEGMKVADLGSGAGFYSIAAAHAVGQEGKVYAVDIQQDLLSRLQQSSQEQRAHNIEIIWGDLEKLGGTKIHDNLVDVVFIANVLFQLDSKQEIFKEAFRILRPTGRMLFIDWKDAFGGLGPTPDRIVPDTMARRLAEEAGLVVEKTVMPGDHHYGFVARKPKQ